jgi:XTP/dITP diphosphohydrolase
MTRLVLASANPHKAQEFARLLPGHEVEPWSGDLPEETGQTFLDNARLKAWHVHNGAPGSWVLADDSGIEAAALGGAPGVRSALAGSDDRRVAYVAQLVAIDPDGRELLARGELRGTLAGEPRGSGGFGYDPAFVPEGETRTVGEMSPAEKDAISHRARAAAELLPQLP